MALLQFIRNDTYFFFNEHLYKFQFVELIIETKIKYTFHANRFTFREAVFLCPKLKGDVNMKYSKNIAK